MSVQQFVGVTPGMHGDAWCDKFVATGVSIAK